MLRSIRTGKYRSRFEALVALQLDGVRHEYEPKQKKLKYTVEKKYQPDFWIPEHNLFVETKGYFSQADRTKMVAVKRAHPELRMLLVFQNAKNRLSSRSAMTYAKWAEKNGFEWCERSIPQTYLHKN
jgi:hypothetical protein